MSRQAMKLFGIILLPLTLLAQTATPQDDVIRVETNMVTVPVTVKTHGGAHIPNLQPKDFHIYEDGVEQEISQFETVDKQSMTAGRRRIKVEVSVPDAVVHARESYSFKPRSR